MGKSLRNKKKVAARTQKRTDSFYAVHHAARLQRLSSKLQSGADAEVKEDEMKVDGETVKDEEKKGGDEAKVVKTEDDAEMDTPKKISTSGPRLNRREEWRMAKGLSIRPDSKGLNNMGTAKARRKSGRSARRR
ncbi:hypothetical protein QFC21_006086 [Naganishia friedmannii]|uniref:Uncharacterized protein n=1 Tax=Naganishia friedmannii TaxID=89922 RepID=A0ACC2V5S6_9TREE|nr:hypothetical protein QFC21_006086 [Naganishia friedmannii]